MYVLRIIWKSNIASHWSKGKKENLTERTRTGDERALVLSANLDNVLGRRLENYNLGIGDTRGDGN